MFTRRESIGKRESPGKQWIDHTKKKAHGKMTILSRVAVSQAEYRIEKGHDRDSS